MIGGGVLSYGGDDRPDGGHEDGFMVLSHGSGGPLLGDFFHNSGFLFDGS